MAIQEFEASTDIKNQRAIFERISAAMEVEIAKQTITSGTIYKQYCPMAFDGKGGYWLSNSKEVRNPYYGDKMLKCGTIDKELN
jgi:phosphoribosylaminoimidazole carboxylase (NCAIR synthetase)